MRLCRLTLCIASLAFCLAAHADTYQFSFGSATSSFSGSGLLTTGSAVAPGEFFITSLSGTTRRMPNGPSLAIDSLLAPGSFPTSTNGGTFPANDNYLFVLHSAGRPDEDGFSFLVSDGAQVNLFDDGPGVNALLLPDNGVLIYEEAALSITPVVPTPEPSSLVLMLTGVLGFATCLRRRSV